MSKLNIDHDINLEIDEEDIKQITFKKDTTYQEIKDYTLKKHRLKVSTLYIAQIKRKIGIVERKNYNLSKKEKQKIPVCPPEKEAAIRDAFEWFGMF
ncbi:RNA methyltransferase [Streptococcus caprae]|uniref:RNA methyltransferase n=1 Tax=Streptococcus caprae TaxID=1640501 RepID=A0ABV8CTS0_9STRE